MRDDNGQAEDQDDRPRPAAAAVLPGGSAMIAAWPIDASRHRPSEPITTRAASANDGSMSWAAKYWIPPRD